ncbi:hypothetical protein ATJ97_3116 [Georgenia soli]|uniref:Uncharacterized protein n=1 Tax=Georgenia soli TaxID=638953 RepID=A0A2A9EPQ6_9MICO|nr:putative transporter small subunit [Georgenia soli]PFG40586.1 hypothetical protein ATJ97_3116 [Georgenia soli]
MAAALSAYVLMWPALVLVVMAAIARGFAKDVRDARREGRDIV